MAAPRSHGFGCCALALILAVPALGQETGAPSHQRSVAIAAHVSEAARRFGIPEHWIYAVIRAESGGLVGAVSPAGAIGLMQLMPGTWARQRARFGLGADPFDPRDNIMAGASYLREMYDLYGGIGMLAAYNAGPGRYEAWRDRGRQLPAETRTYVAKLAPVLQSGSAASALAVATALQPPRISWPEVALFVPRSKEAKGELSAGADRHPAQRAAPMPRRADGLFVSVSTVRAK